MSQARHVRSPDRAGVATIRFLEPQVATVGFKATSAIADIPLYDDYVRPDHAPALTLREYLARQDQKLTPNRRVKVPIGLVPRIYAMLIARGWKVTIRRDSHVEVLNLFPHLRPDDWDCPELLRRAYGRICTLALVPKLTDRIQHVAALRQQYPEAHILVVARNTAEAKSAARYLASQSQVLVTNCCQPRYSYPWTHIDCVSSFTGRSVTDWAFVVFLDAELAVSQTSKQQLEPMFGSMRIGFLVRDERKLNEWDRAIIEGLFGQVIYRPDDYQGGTEVRVAWLATRRFSYQPQFSTEPS